MKSKKMELVKELVKLAVEFGGDSFNVSQKITWTMINNGLTTLEAYKVWKKLEEEAKQGETK